MINKIQVGSKTYSVGGGGGVAKLVERFELSGDDASYNIELDLKKPLEIGKIYLVVYYDNVGNFCATSSILPIMNGVYDASFIGMTSSETDALVQVNFSYNLHENRPFMQFAVAEDRLYYHDQVIEIYELPFKIGGNE